MHCPFSDVDTSHHYVEQGAATQSRIEVPRTDSFEDKISSRKEKGKPYFDSTLETTLEKVDKA